MIARVGKTSIVRRCAYDEYNKRFLNTIVCDFLRKKVDLGDTQVMLIFWDTSGQERFGQLPRIIYRKLDLCVITYDVTSRKSFDSVSFWRENFESLKEMCSEDVPIMILGNKIDKQVKREVTYEEGKSFCELGKNIIFFEVSAKTSDGINSAFEEAARKAVIIKMQQEKSQALVNVPAKVDEGRKNCC